jgi:histidine triad (HIT) family protein
MNRTPYSNPECVFCKISQHLLPANLRYEDEEMVAFDDIKPSAPIHVLVIPKEHIESLSTTTMDHQSLLGKLLYRCKVLAEELGIADSGYRLVINNGKWGGQIVPHLHIHILGGVPLSEKIEFAIKEESPHIKTKTGQK